MISIGILLINGDRTCAVWGVVGFVASLVDAGGWGGGGTVGGLLIHAVEQKTTESRSTESCPDREASAHLPSTSSSPLSTVSSSFILWYHLKQSVGSCMSGGRGRWWKRIGHVELHGVVRGEWWERRV